ncbi:MAG: dihydrofolate reductase [Burkholderiaceae bacterium]|nr:dihydrofolate reductase [Burkholderiaceae bacterium]
MHSLSIIVAFDKNNGIGIQNRMPWHLPEDLAHFKKTTSGHTIIMGRKTFESIGKALPNRRNVVLTNNADWMQNGVEKISTINHIMPFAQNDAVFIIGGAQIYQQVMGIADTLIVTEIDAEFACDAFFPQIDRSIWQETNRERHYSDKNQWHYSFVTYKKKENYHV